VRPPRRVVVELRDDLSIWPSSWASSGSCSWVRRSGSAPASHGVLRDTSLAKLNWLGARGLLSRNDDNAYVGSGGSATAGSSRRPQRVSRYAPGALGIHREPGNPGLVAAMFEDFVFQYRTDPGAVGLSCYRLLRAAGRALAVVKRTPRLRASRSRPGRPGQDGPPGSGVATLLTKVPAVPPGGPASGTSTR